ncbi:MAG TPA: hypothetical protein VIJ38_01625 [Acidobacteriaceae bacterium]
MGAVGSLASIACMWRTPVLPLDCARMVSPLARLQAGWDDAGVLDLKFDHTLAHVDNPGVLTVFSQKAKLQNGFGAYKHIVLYCDYDTQAQTKAVFISRIFAFSWAERGACILLGSSRYCANSPNPNSNSEHLK